MSNLNFSRPLYHSNNAALVDIISENMYYNSKELKDNLVNTVSKAYDKVTDFYKNDKNALPFTTGTVCSIAVNYFATRYASNHEFSPAKIKFYSFIGESAVSTAFATGAFYWKAFERGIKDHSVGKELWSTTKYLGKLVPFTFALSFGPYRLVKNLGSDVLIYFGMSPSLALPLVQTALLYPFVKSIEYTQDSAKYVGESIKYFRANPGSLKISVRNRRDAVGLRLSIISDSIKDTSGVVFEMAREKSTSLVRAMREKMRA